LHRGLANISRKARRKLKSTGEVVDELIANPVRLKIAHLCMGLLTSGAYWIRPGTFTPRLPGRVGMGGSPSLFIVIETSISWLPHVFALFVAVAVLSGRDAKATHLYIALAGFITLASIGFYLDLFNLPIVLPTFVISMGTFLTLAAAIALCCAIWPKDVSI
jgi:hypothetical protein